MTLPDYEYKQIERNRPHINEESFSEALEDVRNASGENDMYPVLIVAAAIHELSNMVNEHIAEFYRCSLEREADHS